MISSYQKLQRLSNRSKVVKTDRRCCFQRFEIYSKLCYSAPSRNYRNLQSHQESKISKSILKILATFKSYKIPRELPVFPCYLTILVSFKGTHPSCPLSLIDYHRPNSFPFLLRLFELLSITRQQRRKKRRLRGMKGRFQGWRCEKAGHEGRSGPRLVRCLFSTQAFRMSKVVHSTDALLPSPSFFCVRPNETICT